MPAFETPPKQSDPLFPIKKTILVDIRSELDSFAGVHEDFFNTCESYSADCSKDTRWNLEQAAVTLEVGIIDIMHAIAANQRYPTDKIKMAHGFMVAEDDIRVGILRPLAPNVALTTHREAGDILEFDKAIPGLLRISAADQIVETLIKSTVEYMHADVARFTKAVAVS